MRLDSGAGNFKHAFEIGKSGKTASVKQSQLSQRSRYFATGRPAICRSGLFNSRPTERGVHRTRAAASALEGNMVAGVLRSTVGGVFALLAFAIIVAAPATAATQARAAPPSTDAILRWINGYRHRPEPDRLPILVNALSQMQAFKDSETCGAYIGFIAGVLGSNPARAKGLVARMLSIASADRWVLVRAIAYSGLSNWKDVLLSSAEDMPEWRPMINRYLEGKLPTLEQIDYKPAKPGMIDKIKIALKIGDEGKKPVTLAPSPELIDVLWGYYLATGAYKPIGQIIKLLPLADDKDSVDNLTTGSAAKFTLASSAVRDFTLLAMLKWSVNHQPKETAKVLKQVIVTAEDVDTADMRKQSLAAIEELKQKGPNSKRELAGMGEIGQGALAVGCIAAAAVGQVELGIPCVIGGATYSAGMQYMSSQ
jgi:hypothetical protein